MFLRSELVNFKIFIYWPYFIFVGVHRLFVTELRLALDAASGGYSLRSAWASHFRAFLFAENSPWSISSVVVAHRLSFLVTCRIFLAQELNPCPLQILNLWTTEEVLWPGEFLSFYAYFCAEALGVSDVHVVAK